MSKIEDTIQSIKEKLPNITPTPPEFHPHANAHELKARLDLGEPALTVFDVRDRTAFQACRILGAMSLPLESLHNGDQPRVDINRDMYVYGDTDEQTLEAANLIRGFGFNRVAELQGGLQDWQAIGGTVEGNATGKTHADADEYNVVSRLKEFSEERSREEEIATE
ncbi:MAG: rhodanese-like domain-containing protein [Oculatellaceae cyanobacterium Prado106]|jgi:rhodanese-related sulfurtransferase|nr:rhodanese-like domain-containing protein [Oculatellaceae cyanobacterium Prado106]